MTKLSFVPFQPSDKPSWAEIDAKADQIAEHIVSHLEYRCYGSIAIYGSHKAQMMEGSRADYLAFTQQLESIDLSSVGYVAFKEDLRGDGNGLQHFENAIARQVFKKIGNGRKS